MCRYIPLKALFINLRRYIYICGWYFISVIYVLIIMSSSNSLDFALSSLDSWWDESDLSGDESYLWWDESYLSWDESDLGWDECGLWYDVLDWLSDLHTYLMSTPGNQNSGGPGGPMGEPGSNPGGPTGGPGNNPGLPGGNNPGGGG